MYVHDRGFPFSLSLSPSPRIYGHFDVDRSTEEFLKVPNSVREHENESKITRGTKRKREKKKRKIKTKRETRVYMKFREIVEFLLSQNHPGTNLHFPWITRGDDLRSHRDRAKSFPPLV